MMTKRCKVRKKMLWKMANKGEKKRLFYKIQISWQFFIWNGSTNSIARAKMPTFIIFYINKYMNISIVLYFVRTCWFFVFCSVFSVCLIGLVHLCAMLCNAHRPHSVWLLFRFFPFCLALLCFFPLYLFTYFIFVRYLVVVSFVVILLWLIRAPNFYIINLTEAE